MAAPAVFTRSFTQQEAIPEDAIEAAVAVLRHGRLHRYNTVEGEESETQLLEEEFAALVGSKYALSVASGGYAISTSLRAVGVRPGDHVLTNAFTLAPVPGAISSVGATPVFVEVSEGLVIDLDDLAAKAKHHSGIKVLVLSHMRGHIVDMDKLMSVCATAGLTVIEDCAHTMGARWRGTPSGRFGISGCYSTQTYKHVNSGEGGLLVSDDADFMARAIMFSGSYMFFSHHKAGPPEEAFKKQILQETPNISGRMDNLRASILRPQLKRLNAQCEAWNARYRVIEEGLKGTAGLTIVERPKEEEFVASSFQFLLLDWAEKDVIDVVQRCKERGVLLKWFGADQPSGYTSKYSSWTYAGSQPLPKSDRVLRGVIDFRIPLTFSLEDCKLIAKITSEEVSAVARSCDESAEAATKRARL
eukprot:TRINITY_DN9848_c0_g1_i1.p1 TRINITY_DN9848_c0_g1~~TRINITY_DN9848_c0_g1_i1.p1  ORF type:complete len:445 (-),score=76.58 TRINITY_DN9848_c0_g1_i1:127-1377(-)